MRVFRRFGESMMAHTSIYMIARSVAALVQLTLLVTLTKILTLYEFGKLALFMAALSSAMTFFCNPVRHIISRYLPMSETQIVEFRSQIFWLWIVTYSSSILVFILASQLPIDWISFSYLPLALVLLAVGWSEVVLEYFRRSLQPVCYLRLFLIRALTRLIFASAFAYYFRTAEGVMWGIVTGSFMACLATPILKFVGTVLASRRTLEALWQKSKPWLRYAAPLTVAELIISLISQLDRYMIGAFLGLEQVGLFAATHDLIWMGLHTFSLVAYLSYFPFAVKCFEEKRYEDYRKTMKDGLTLLFGMGTASSIGLYVLAEPASAMFLGQAFQLRSSALVGLIAFSHFLFVIKVYWMDAHFSIGKSTLSLISIGIFVLMTNLLANGLMIPKFGIIGSAVATILSLFLGCIITGITAHFAMPKFAGFLHYVNILDLLKITVGLVVMVLGMWIIPDYGDSKLSDLFWLSANVVIGGIIFAATIFTLGLDALSEKTYLPY